MDEETVGQQIARGHAWRYHRHEFNVTDREDFANLIDGMVSNPNDRLELSDGRMAYWNDGEQAIVITNPNDPDGGTAFKPSGGKRYFESLK